MTVMPVIAVLVAAVVLSPVPLPVLIAVVVVFLVVLVANPVLLHEVDRLSAGAIAAKSHKVRANPRRLCS